jgi:hypothetical protein
MKEMEKSLKMSETCPDLGMPATVAEVEAVADSYSDDGAADPATTSFASQAVPVLAMAATAFAFAVRGGL